MSNQKQPWEMPTPPPAIQAIINKLDADKDLAEWEHEKLAEWEDSQGGFGGIGIMPDK